MTAPAYELGDVTLPNPAGDNEFDPNDYFISHAGIADNPGIPQRSLLALRRQFKNNPSQLAAREHGKFVKPEGLILKVFDPIEHSQSIPVDDLREMLKKCYIFAGLDPGKLRWAFTLFCSTPERQIWLIDEIFDQYGNLDSRAEKIDMLMKHLDINRRFPIFADCANPTDIGEINEAFIRRGKSTERLSSRIGEIRAQAVGMDKKLIKPGILRIESLIVRGAFRVRRETGEGMKWQLGWNSQSDGIPQIGSRWLYEIGQWQWKKPDREMEKAQKEEPNDDSADGADMMASTRYAIMSVIKKGKEKDENERQAFSSEALQEDTEKVMKLGNRLKKKGDRQRQEIERAINDY